MTGESCFVAKGRPRARGLARRSGWAVMVVLAFVLRASPVTLAAAGPGGRSAVAATAPGDRAATQLLLEADYRLTKVTLARALRVRAAEARAAQALGRECKGVLRGVPDESAIEEAGPLAAGPALSGRAQGERARSEQEKRTIDLEIDETIVAGVYRVLRGPYDAYIAAVDRLTWSDPAIDALVHQRTAGLRADLAGPPVAACAEMKAWAASGFHVLPPGSKRLEESTEARSKQVPQGDLEALLRPYEGPAGQAIIRRVDELRERLREKERADEWFASVEYHMELALGEKPSPLAEQMLAAVIGKGRTSAGTTFVVRRSVRRGLSRSCRREVEVEVREGNGGSGGGVCLGRGSHSRPSGSCSGSVETVELATPPDVPRARVRLSDGRSVTVSVVRVPASDGGPAGVIIDAFRGYDPHPVSVQELSGAGRVLRTVSLSRVRCIREPAADAPGPPQPVSLATVTAPSGESLTIAGILHRFRGQTELLLGPQAGVRNSQGGEERGQSKLFRWNLSTECAPRAYSLLDGVLAPPGTSVLVRTPGGLSPLTKVELASSTNAGGPLFYGVYATPPTEIVVEGSDGSVLYTESLAAKATEETEFCEGYAER